MGEEWAGGCARRPLPCRWMEQKGLDAAGGASSESRMVLAMRTTAAHTLGSAFKPRLPSLSGPPMRSPFLKSCATPRAHAPQPLVPPPLPRPLTAVLDIHTYGGPWALLTLAGLPSTSGGRGRADGRGDTVRDLQSALCMTCMRHLINLIRKRQLHLPPLQSP